MVLIDIDLVIEVILQYLATPGSSGVFRIKPKGAILDVRGAHHLLRFLAIGLILVFQQQVGILLLAVRVLAHGILRML